MLVEILLALFLGFLVGIFTGLFPGIHVNLVTVLLVSVSPLLLTLISPLGLCMFIISLAITHSFLDAIPSIYLGAPDEAQAMGALPGHRLLLEGRGHAAIVYTIMGSFGALLLGIVLFPVFLYLMKILQGPISAVVGYLLIGMVVYMILKDKDKRLRNLILFTLSGVLGIIVFYISELRQPLFALLSGLFGVSILVESLRTSSSIPTQQKVTELSLSSKNRNKAVSASCFVGFIAGFLPGFSSSQGAVVATNMVGDIGDEGFLVLVGGINTANMLISIGTAYALDKARNGAIVAVDTFLGTMTFEQMLIFISGSLVVAGLSVVACLYLSKLFARFITRVPYTELVLGIMSFIILLAALFDGFLGLLILAVATALGVMATSWGVAKSHLMGCLLVPVILFFVL